MRKRCSGFPHRLCSRTVPLNIEFPNRTQRRDCCDHVAGVVVDRGAEAVDARSQAPGGASYTVFAYLREGFFELPANCRNGNLGGFGNFLQLAIQHLLQVWRAVERSERPPSC